MLSQAKNDRVFHIINYAILTLVLVVVLYPMYFIIIASVSDPSFVYNGDVHLWPKGFLLDGYKKVFAYTAVWVGFRNTILYTVCGTALNVLMTLGVGYTLSRRSFVGKGMLMTYMLIPMFFTGGLIPTYLVVKGLGMYDTMTAMIVLNAVNIFNVIITRTFLQETIPHELFESAQMDGCNHFAFFFRIVLPLSSSIIAVLTLYYGVDHWNDFFTSLIYLSNHDLYSLQLVLRSILIEANIPVDSLDQDDIVRRQREGELLKYALIVVTSLPIIMVYPFVQKYFVKGVMIGSVKG